MLPSLLFFSANQMATQHSQRKLCCHRIIVFNSTTPVVWGSNSTLVHISNKIWWIMSEYTSFFIWIALRLTFSLKSLTTKSLHNSGMKSHMKYLKEFFHDWLLKSREKHSPNLDPDRMILDWKFVQNHWNTKLILNLHTTWAAFKSENSFKLRHVFFRTALFVPLHGCFRFLKGNPLPWLL